ncbi:MAG TPA: SDR family oxidoreductase [Candidatus Limnocylindrales bacterium]
MVQEMGTRPGDSAAATATAVGATRGGPLAGQVILVTGGARGLGEAICRSLAEAGATVVAADVRADLVEEVSSSLTAAGHAASSVVLDLADDSAIEAALERVVAEHGRLDVLVNNAGTDVTLPIEELSVADVDRVLGVNLRAPILLARAVLPRMKAQGSGHIVNVASTAAKRAWPNASLYHASKWGLLGFSHALHTEARPSGVKVTAVVAGGMRTPFLLDRFPDIDVGTLQDPRNVADTIRFLLTQPAETVIPEVLVLPMRETSWP